MSSPSIASWRVPLFLVVLALLGAAPWWLERAALLRGVEIAYFVALAQMWNLLAGYAGLMSIGQQLYVGLGGYALYLSVIHLGLPVLWGLPLAGGVAALAALPAALTLFRLRGAYFAIGSWVLAESVMLAIAKFEVLGGASGLSLPAAAVRALAASADQRAQTTWWLALSLAVAATALVFAWLRSRQGLALTALRDNETAAAGLGVETFRVKLAVYLAAATVTGMIGALIFLNKLRMSPAAAFSIGDWTASVIFIVVIGGIGSIEGPLLGALVFFALRELLADYGTWYQLLLGAIAVLTMVKAPRGLWGLLRQRWDVSLFPVRRVFRDATVVGAKPANLPEIPRPEPDARACQLPNWYVVLGVAADATEREIEDAYRAASVPGGWRRSVYSWLVGRDRRSLATAYETLIDAQRRKAYDQALRDGGVPYIAGYPGL